MLCFNDTATTESYTLSLHDALPICAGPAVGDWVALRGELAVAVLPRRTAFTRVLAGRTDRKSTRLNSSHANISYAVFCLKKKRLWGQTCTRTCNRPRQRTSPSYRRP